MSKINILESSVFNLIAAGEVVERPASVVKEVVENSIDAGATIITVEISGGGIEKIKVSDNGCGVEEEDLVKAFLPHATSKIRDEGDLSSISSLGFRGEALASIASVSRVNLSSRTKNSDSGFSVDVVAGAIGEVQPKGCPEGTFISVENLFFNVPARAKFLRKPKTEELEVSNLVARFILANPLISFKYMVDGKVVYVSSGKSLEDAMICVYGKDVLKDMCKIDSSFDNLKISGYVCLPTYSKPNRTYQTVILNGRYISNSTIASAIQNAYSEFLMKRQYPMYVLHFCVPFESVDVNVHPNKMDVRFENSGKIYSAVFESVVRAINDIKIVKSFHNDAIIDVVTGEVKVDEKNKLETEHFSNSQVVAATNFFKESFKSVLKSENTFCSESVLTDFSLLPKEEPVSEKSYNSDALNGLMQKLEKTISKQEQTEMHVVYNDFSILGVAFKTYIIIQMDSELWLLDQHAGHERIKFDELRSQIENNFVSVQPLLVPFVFDVNDIELDFLNENIEILKKIGFEVESFGEKTFRISAIPALLTEINLSDFIQAIFADMKKLKISQGYDFIKEKLMSMACKSAVKGGDDLSKDQVEFLINKIISSKATLLCPHGRPIIVKISKDEIEKWFKRIV